MKTAVFLLIFSALITHINAQEINHVNNSDNNDLIVAKKANDKNSIDQASTSIHNNLIKDICYAEISKVAFYKALIRQNGFDIHIKDNDDHDIALKNTEEIITNNKDRISYSD